MATTPAASRTSSIAPPERFGLTGPTRPLDPRTHAFRKDIADIALAADVFAPHYAWPVPSRLVSGEAMLRAAPNEAAVAVSQLARGEGFAVVDESAGWAWGRCLHDDYVGYLPSAALGAPEDASHVVTAPLALRFAAPDIKAHVVGSLSIGARVRAVAAGDFLEVEGSFLHARHLAPVGQIEGDPVAIAERLIGQPYLWGGRGAGGIDCSGLVQRALGLCGIAAPRDSDQQRDSLGRALDAGEMLRRGDLLFFAGHVGMMVDEARMIHANAWWMAVTIEPLAEILGRLGDDAVITRRRVSI